MKNITEIMIKNKIRRSFKEEKPIVVKGFNNPPLKEHEIIKEIAWAEDYMITNFGRIWSKTRYNSRGALIKGKWMKITKNKRGTYIVLYINRKYCNFSLPRMLYKSFMGEIPEGYAIFHKDGNKYNNDLSNIGLSLKNKAVSKTRTKAFENGYLDRMVSSKNNKTDEARASQVIDLYEKRYSIKEIKEKLNMSHTTILRIAKEAKIYRKSKYSNKMDEALMQKILNTYKKTKELYKTAELCSVSPIIAKKIINGTHKIYRKHPNLEILKKYAII